MKTFMAKAADVERKWYVIDATGLPLGRLASETAKILRGKNKPIYTPYVDTGDHVIIINAEKFSISGQKLDCWQRSRNGLWNTPFAVWFLTERLAIRCSRNFMSMPDRSIRMLLRSRRR